MSGKSSRKRTLVLVSAFLAMVPGLIEQRFLRPTESEEHLKLSIRFGRNPPNHLRCFVAPESATAGLTIAGYG